MNDQSQQPKMRPWPADRIERWGIDRIRPYPRNVMLHSDEQIGKLANSLLAFGVTAPLLVDEEGVLIYGHGRRMAAELLVKRGLSEFAELPVVVARGWTEDEKAAYRIADNQLGRLSDFDMPALKAEILELQSTNFNLSLTGFDALDLRQITANPAGEDPDATQPDPPANPVTRRGDIWVMGAHRLGCGDCTNEDDVERLLQDARPHLMATDAPYGVDYDPNWRNEADRVNGKPYGARAIGLVQNDNRSDWREAWALFPGDIAYCWHADRHASNVQQSLEANGFEIVSQIIWAKDRLIISRGDYHWQHEPCWYAVRKGKTHLWSGSRSQTTLWSISHMKSETGHSTQKPIECMRRPIENNSQPGDWVYDPFSGSFTTGIACELTARKALALEIDPGYVDVSVRRWERISGKVAVLEQTGRTFAQEAAERGIELPPAITAPQTKSDPESPDRLGGGLALELRV